MSSERDIQVSADWWPTGGPQAVGTLRSTSQRSQEVLSFEYDGSWLGSGHELVLDPDLALFEGRHRSPLEIAKLGVFLDSAPDGWGRSLMQRHEAWEAGRMGREPRDLMESDYLLGVQDVHRMGALRFRQGTALKDDHVECVSPPWATLRALQNASLKLEAKGVEDSPDYALWLRILIAPGGSLGGSRPKASVSDWDDHLWLAKFPRAADTVDVGAWEYVVRELGQRAGLAMAEARMEQFGSPHRTFLSRRFDRSEGGARRHMASARTLLGRADEVSGSKGATQASYLDLAEFIQRQGSQPDLDLLELWRRIAFYVAVSNTDDHLRNHAFLLEASGWRLAPAYDVNSHPQGTGLTLNISEGDNALSWDLVREVAPSFRVKDRQVKKTLRSIQGAVATWRDVAAGVAIGHAEIQSMEGGFAASASSAP